MWITRSELVASRTSFGAAASHLTFEATNYVSGWRLSAEQLKNVLTTGRLF